MLKVAGIQEKDRDTPLTEKIFTDPTHKVTSTLLTIYCMEGFVYRTLNHALRTQDKTKVTNLGAYAQALNTIVTGAAEERKDIEIEMFNKIFEPMDLYRGAC